MSFKSLGIEANSVTRRSGIKHPSSLHGDMSVSKWDDMILDIAPVFEQMCRSIECLRKGNLEGSNYHMVACAQEALKVKNSHQPELVGEAELRVIPQRRAMAVKLLLIATEAFEAMAEIWAEQEHGEYPAKFSFELADIILRTVGLAASAGVDLDLDVAEKQRLNGYREKRHGKKSHL